MSRRRKSSARAIVLRPSFGGFRAPAPVVITRRVGVVKHKKHHRRRRGSSVGISGLTGQQNLILGGAAFVLGYIDKQGVKIPTVPVLGRAGSMAVGLWLLSRWVRSPFIAAGAKAATVIAAYELGNKGQVSGVHGVNTV